MPGGSPLAASIVATLAALGLACAPGAPGGNQSTGGSASGGVGAGGIGGRGTGGGPAGAGAAGAGGSASGSAGGSGGGGTGGSGAGAGAGGTTGGAGATDAQAPSTPPPVVDEALPPCKRMVPVAGAGALAGALGGAMPGDCLLAADGEYGGLTIDAKGTAEAPIVLRAARRGGAVFTGRVMLSGAAHVVIDGFNYMGGSGVTIASANNNRISRGRFRLGGGTWILINGTSTGNRIDHNDLGPLVGEGHFMNPTGMSERTRIDHNHVHDLNACGGNGCETISLGCCGAAADAHETFNVVEYNLLVNCDGESEMIGMKSSSNTVRFNTIRRSRGQISFRAGKKNTAHSNYLLGEGKAGTQGIRLLDEDHLVYNNYVDVAGFPLRMQHGDVPGFPPIRRARVVHNTFVVNGAPLELGGTGHSVAPADSTFANNLIVGSGTLISEKGNGIALQGNIAFGNVGVMKPVDQLRIVDPMLVPDGVGEVLRPQATSATVGAAVGSFPFVTHDIEGLLRMAADVGAHEWSGTPGHGPLTPADVGPDAP